MSALQVDPFLATTVYAFAFFGIFGLALGVSFLLEGWLKRNRRDDE